MIGYGLIAADSWRRRDHQPLVDRRQNVAVVADCRLDNRDELRRSLCLDGASNDGALLLQAYAKWGPGMASHIEGDFAVIVWDWHHKKLLALRDHLGIKPIYYWIGQREAAIASDVGILVDLIDAPLTPDDRLIVEHLLMQYRSADRTFWSDIKRLPGGHTLLIEPHKSFVTSYWTPPENEIQPQSTEQVHENLRGLFSQAVERRLDSDSPLVAHLSGGLDSSSIVCVADQIYKLDDSRPALRVVSALYPGLECDESLFIRTVLDQVNFDAESWDGRGEGIFPLYAPSVIGPGMGAEKAGDVAICLRIGARVLLSGQGGDHVGGCYGVPEDRVSRRSAGAILTSVCGPGVAFTKRVARLRQIARLLAPLPLRRLVGSVRAQLNVPPWLQPEWRRVAGTIAAAGYPEDSTRTMSHVKRRHWEEVTAASLGLALDSDQHRATAAGVEIRYPFLDRALVEYVLSIPFPHWPAPAFYSRLQREFLASLLPEGVRLRTKTLFSAGVAHRLRLAWPRLRSLFFDGEWRSARYVNRKAAQALMVRGAETAGGDDWPLWRAIWGIGMLEAWLRAISGYAHRSGRI